MVIFGPIVHVGWASASSTVTSASSAARAATERAAAGGEHDPRRPRGRRRSPTRRHWWTAQCSLSTGTSSAPGVARSGCTTGPAAIRLSLLASAEPLAGTQRGDRDRQPGEADDAVDHDVRQLDQVGSSPTTSIPNGSAAATSARARGVGDGDNRRPELLRLLDQRLDGRPDAERDDLVALGPSARTTSSVWVPIDPVEPAIATRRAPSSSS